jgi:hypothetical protein
MSVLQKTVEVSVKSSTLPPSFEESTFRFTAALFSVTAIALISCMTVGWMLREIWRDRNHVRPTEPLFVFRMIIVFFSTAAVIRCLPEAIYMTTFREASVQFTADILAFKRRFDAVALLPVACAHGLLWAYYLGMCSQMSQCRDIPYKPAVAWPQFKRLLLGAALVLAIAVLVAVGKR